MESWIVVLGETALRWELRYLYLKYDNNYDINILKMKIGVIINIIIIFLLIFYTLFAGVLEFFIKLRIKSINTKYSWKGSQKPPSNYHKINPNSLLINEIRTEAKHKDAMTEEYYNLMNFKDELPMIQQENDYVNDNSKIIYKVRYIKI